MVSVKEVNGWSKTLPFNIKFKTQIRNGHNKVISLYNDEIEEVIHIVFNNRNKYNSKWYVVTTDITNEKHRTEKLYRKVLPFVEDEIVTIWSGSSGRFIFEEHSSPQRQTKQKAQEKIMNYMKNNP